MNRARLCAALFTAASLLAGCSGMPEVHRVSPEQTTDVSGHWNDTDARMTAEQMVSQMLTEPWLDAYGNAHGGQRPVVIVGEIRNLSSEHISVSIFVKSIQRELINSGQVRFVASSRQRGAVREERKDQDLNATAETRNPMGQEIGADFVMQGTINTIIDAAGDLAVKYYQVNLQLVDMRNNLIAWIGQKRIKKTVEHASFRF